MPDRIEAFFTRDYPLPWGKTPCFQGGFLVLHPSEQRLLDFIDVIKKGDYRAGDLLDPNVGWGSDGYGNLYGPLLAEACPLFLRHSTPRNCRGTQRMYLQSYGNECVMGMRWIQFRSTQATEGIQGAEASVPERKGELRRLSCRSTGMDQIHSLYNMWQAMEMQNWCYHASIANQLHIVQGITEEMDEYSNRSGDDIRAAQWHIFPEVYTGTCKGEGMENYIPSQL